jgi:hypothetical protein
LSLDADLCSQNIRTISHILQNINPTQSRAVKLIASTIGFFVCGKTKQKIEGNFFLELVVTCIFCSVLYFCRTYVDLYTSKTFVDYHCLFSWASADFFPRGQKFSERGEGEEHTFLPKTTKNMLFFSKKSKNILFYDSLVRPLGGQKPPLFPPPDAHVCLHMHFLHSSGWVTKGWKIHV